MRSVGAEAEKNIKNATTQIKIFIYVCLSSPQRKSMSFRPTNDHNILEYILIVLFCFILHNTVYIT